MKVSHDNMRFQLQTEHPHGSSDIDIDELFTKEQAGDLSPFMPTRR